MRGAREPTSARSSSLAPVARNNGMKREKNTRRRGVVSSRLVSSTSVTKLIARKRTICGIGRHSARKRQRYLSRSSRLFEDNNVYIARSISREKWFTDPSSSLCFSLFYFRRQFIDWNEDCTNYSVELRNFDARRAREVRVPSNTLLKFVRFHGRASPSGATSQHAEYHTHTIVFTRVV